MSNYIIIVGDGKEYGPAIEPWHGARAKNRGDRSRLSPNGLARCAANRWHRANRRPRPAWLWRVWCWALCRWYFFPLGLMLGIPAVICGHLAWGAIRAEPELLGGKGLVVAGLITGYLGIVVGALSLLGAVVMAVSIYLGFR